MRKSSLNLSLSEAEAGAVGATGAADVSARAPVHARTPAAIRERSERRGEGKTIV
jgi:hypothetical protein